MNKNGFTMIEMLIGISTACLCTLMFMSINQVLLRYAKEDYHIEDELAIQQLRYKLIQSNQMIFSSNSLSFQYRGDNCSLEFASDYLVKRPGFEIFMMNIKAGDFYKDGSCIYASWLREGDTEAQEALLYCE